MVLRFITCKRIISFMVILGFMIHHMLRLNITIALIDMTKNNSNYSNHSSFSYFTWNEEQKNDIMGYFFWGYLLTQIPGGRLSEIFGTKIVVGMGFFIASLLTLLTPAACHLGYYWVLGTRFALGLSLGVHWPATPPMAAKWASDTDTSKFMSHMVASSLGAALMLSCCGYLIAYQGWPSAFYFTGAISLMWTLAWFYLVYDSPEKHPRISAEEEKVLKKIKRFVVTKEKDIPWKCLLTSLSVWAFIVANTCSAFTVYIALFQFSSYLDQIHHVNIKKNGLLSSLPHIARYVMAICSSYLADKMIKSEQFSRGTVRKIFATASYWGPGVLFSIQAFWGYNIVTTIVVFTTYFAFMSLAAPGVLANCVDISPSFSGTILGLSHLPVGIVGYLSTKVVANFTKEEQTFKQWTYIFWILVTVNLFASIFFLVFASGSVQKWNSKTKCGNTEENIALQEKV